MGTNLGNGLVAEVFLLCSGQAVPPEAKRALPLIPVLGEYLAAPRCGCTFLPQSPLRFLWWWKQRCNKSCRREEADGHA